MAARSTIVPPPLLDKSKSQIENSLEIRPLKLLGPDISTNSRPLWRPDVGKGIFGGAVAAQCLNSAYHTVDPSLVIHSVHCYFVLPADAETPLIYHVERLRDGKNFATRTVHARQNGKTIVSTAMSFTREPTGHMTLEHQVGMPADERARGQPPDDATLFTNEIFEIAVADMAGGDSSKPHEKRARQWVRVQGRISENGGHRAQSTALAYMSDSFFNVTALRAHGVLRIGPRDSASAAPTRDGHELELGMLTSLDHVIYFHAPHEIRADEWMFVEVQSPWVGSERGVVIGSIFTKEGKLVATCVQEGLMRLKQPSKL